MAQLFGKAKSTVNEHIKNVFAEGELLEDVAVRKFRITTPHGAIEGKTQSHEVNFYNLDVIISVGYRVKSLRGTQFRQWATKRLNEYIRKGFTMDDERLKNLGGGNYWKELIARIRDIRASEKVFYRQVLDIYATSIDYDPHSETSTEFFKKVQNKMHFAVHGQTAAEVIYSRADAEKVFMGQIVSGYLDFAERKAEREEPMTMADWSKHLDQILTAGGEKLLQGNGSVSHEQAVEKATREYKKFQQKTLSSVENAFLDSIKSIEKKVK